jgi:hypothetical protein
MLCLGLPHDTCALRQRKQKKKWLDLSQSCSVILALFSEEEKVSGQLPSFSVMGCANVR